MNTKILALLSITVAAAVASEYTDAKARLLDSTVIAPATVCNTNTGTGTGSCATGYYCETWTINAKAVASGACIPNDWAAALDNPSFTFVANSNTYNFTGVGGSPAASSALSCTTNSYCSNLVTGTCCNARSS